jgi:nitronate monooxygenase
VLAFEPRALSAVLEAGVPVVTFSWGLPGDLVKRVHSLGAAAGVQVGTVEGAKRALEEDCDFIICQGIEAGGHVQSSTPLREILPRIVAVAGTVPVVAAGGLADKVDVAEVKSLRARAAMLGTRFVASTESHAHSAYKQALLAASAQDTAPYRML